VPNERGPEEEKMMETERPYFVFVIESQMFALAVEAVDMVTRAAALTVLPECPKLLLGLLNLHGKRVPVVDLRSHFGLKSRGLRADDCIIICRAGRFSLGLAADDVVGVRRFTAADVDASDAIFPGMEEYISGVGAVDGETVLIYDTGTLFSRPGFQAVKSRMEELDEETGSSRISDNG